MTDLILHFERTMNETGYTVERSTKKKLRKKIKDEFCTSATLAIKVMELQKKLNLYQQNSSTEKSLDTAVETIRKEIKSYKSTLNWPPHIQNIELEQTVIPMNLNRFLCKLFNDVNSKNVG